MDFELTPEKIGLDLEKTKLIVEGMNRYLANLNVLYLKLHNFHWNVVGMGFFDLHEKTEGLYDAVAIELDEIAERILMLGFKPIASMYESSKLATIKEAPSVDINASTIASILIDDFVIILNELRRIDLIAKETTDEYTIGLLGDAMGFFEKNIWMFSAYLTR